MHRRRIDSCFIASVLLTCTTCIHAFEIPPAYRVTGTAECIAESQSGRMKRGDSTNFYIALTPRRILVGWSTKAYFSKVFQYSDGESPPFSLQVAGGSDSMIDTADKRVLELILQGDSPITDASERLRTAQTATLQNFPFAVFFSSMKFGVPPERIEQVDEGGVTTDSGPLGTLDVDATNGLGQIQFSQAEDSLYFDSPQATLLKNTTYPPFDSGLQSNVVTCEFTQPLSETLSQPWQAIHTTETVGRNGHKASFTQRITIEDLLIGEDAIDDEINAWLGLIPENKRIVSPDSVVRLWTRGKVEPEVDVSTSSPWSGRWLLIAANVVIVFVLAWVVLRRRAR